MADKRMISRLVTRKAKFLRMPASAQALYMHLCLEADDEGIAEGFATVSLVRGSDDDLTTLADNGFVVILEPEELVVYIAGWDDFNAIRKDTKRESAYHALLEKYTSLQEAKVNIDSPLQGSQVNSDTSLQGSQVNSDTSLQGSQVNIDSPLQGSQVNIDSPLQGSKVNIESSSHSIVQDSIVQDRVGKNTAATRESTNSEYTSTPVDNSQQQPPLATRLASDGSFAKVVALYQDNIHPIANQVEADDLISMFDDYGEEWLKRAIKEAARNNARSIKYITAILQNWYKRGVPDPWNHKPPGKGSQPRGQTQSERAAEICRGAMELLEAGG